MGLPLGAQARVLGRKATDEALRLRFGFACTATTGHCAGFPNPARLGAHHRISDVSSGASNAFVKRQDC